MSQHEPALIANVPAGSARRRHRARWHGKPRLLAGALVTILALSGCAAGAPTTLVTPTPSPAAAPTRAPTATITPPTATATVPPTSPTAAPAPAATAPAVASVATTEPESATALTAAEDAADEGDAPVALGVPPALQAEIDETGMAALAEYGTSGRREVALTFDAGSDRGNAEGILDLLQAEGIHASFGMMGQWAIDHPDLVLRMVDEGHMLFNHSWTHASLSGFTTETEPLTREQIEQELFLTEEALAGITDAPLRPYFRPPYGDYSEASLRVLAESGYPIALMWSCDTRDSVGATGQEILQCAVDAQPGRIILMHVGAQSEAYSVLPEMIAMLREQGFAFVTADEILQP